MDSKTSRQRTQVPEQEKPVNGEKVVTDGIPYLKLSGSYYEMGKQYGTLLNKELYEINRISRSFIKKVVPWFLKPLSNVYLNRRAKKLQQRIPTKYREEIRGMADGSGLAYKDLLAIAAFPEIFLGCTTVLARINGQVFLARNLDFLPFLGAYSTVVEYCPESGGKVTSIGIIGYGGILTGFNEDGLSLSLNTIAMAQKESSDQVMIGYLNREILENAASLKEAEDRLSGYKSEVGWLITIADTRENDGFICEISTSGNKIHKLGDQQYVAANNSFIEGKLNKENMGVLTAENFRNKGRHEGLKDRLNHRPVSSLDDLVQLLSSVSFYEYEGIELGLGHYAVNNEQSIQSIVIDGTGKCFLLAVGEGYSGFSPFHRYRINQGFTDTYRDGLGKEAIQELLEKRDRMMDLFLDKEFGELAAQVDLDDAPNLYELSGLADLEVAKDNKKLLEAINQEIVKYEKLPELHIKKGKILLELGRNDEAVLVLEAALDLPYVYEADRVMIFRYLAAAYHRLGNQDKAHQYAVECIDLIGQYVIGKEERKVLNEVSRYRLEQKQ